MRILITGGAGYLGRALAVQLRREHSISLLDWAANERPPTTENGEVWDVKRQDVRTIDTLDQGIDCIIHLAAIIGHRQCDEDQALARSVNDDGTANVARLARKADIPLIYASTGAIYGAADGAVVDETTTPNPLSLYSSTKLSAESHVLEAGGCVLRLNHLCGKSPNMTWEQFVNMAARDASRGVLSIYDPDTWRPGTHIADACRAFESALNLQLSGVFDVVGLNHKKGYVGEIAKVSVPTVQVELKDRGIDLNNYQVSGDKFRAVTGWEPRHGIGLGFKEALRVACEG